jgi:hypothetical protein
MEFAELLFDVVEMLKINGMRQCEIEVYENGKRIEYHLKDDPIVVFTELYQSYDFETIVVKKGTFKLPALAAHVRRVA